VKVGVLLGSILSALLAVVVLMNAGKAKASN
jgi:NhaA family Na+:H+ antiporter